MTREEYNELRARAHEQMLDDYKWMLDQESGIREWRCPKRWIIEFVHDVSDYVMVRSSGEEDVGDEWHDDLLRPIPLYGKIENALIRCGIDPYIGILHRDEYGRPVLSYDVIELYRVWIDYIVYSLLAQNIITEDYSTDERGAVWLESLGRRVMIQSVNDYLAENESIKGMTRSRETHIFLYIQKFAQQLKHY